MPMRCRSSSGYRGVRVLRNGTFYAEIRVAELRLTLGTYEMTHKAARAYDAAAWRLGRPRWLMNFDNVNSVAQATALAPPPNVVTQEERQQQIEHCLVIAEADERAMAQWRRNFPEDVKA
ncbi:unnamed protein product [Alopecurus aequalis]